MTCARYCAASGLAQGCTASPGLVNVLSPWWAAAQRTGFPILGNLTASGNLSDDVMLVVTSSPEVLQLVNGYWADHFMPMGNPVADTFAKKTPVGVPDTFIADSHFAKCVLVHDTSGMVFQDLLQYWWKLHSPLWLEARYPDGLS